MNRWLILAVAILSLLPGCAGTSDADVIRGDWKMEKMAGEFTFDLPPYQLDNDFILSFREGTFSFITSKRSGNITEGTYICDEAKTPKQITFVFNGRTVVGIYSLSRNALQICVGQGDASAPKTFAGGPESRPALIEYRRLNEP